MQLVYNLSVVLSTGLLHFNLFPVLFSCPLNFYVDYISLTTVKDNFFETCLISKNYISNKILRLVEHLPLVISVIFSIMT